MKKNQSLPRRILVALLLGVAAGLFCTAVGAEWLAAEYLKPLGDIFVNLLKLIVVPVVLLSVLDGILSMDDMKAVGAVGWRTVLFFLCTTAAACVIGLTAASVFNGLGLFPDLSHEAGASVYEPAEFPGFMNTLVSIFPSNLWQTLSEANMLQVIVIALLLGAAVMTAGEEGQFCRRFAASAYAVIRRLMDFVISLAPGGVFAYMAWVVSAQGAAVLGHLALVLLCAYLAYFVHGLLVYSVLVRLAAALRPTEFFKGISPAVLFAFSSASSAAALPVSGRCAEELGADRGVSAFVLPLGATINMDGTAIYQCVATVFLASCAGMNLTLPQMAIVVLTATLASVGTAGVSGAGMVMLAMTLEAVGVPVSYIGLIVAVDRLFDMGRTGLNVAGDLACTLCVSRWEEKRRP